MSKDNFDPRTFFALHDLNGDGYWNDDELEALFQSQNKSPNKDTTSIPATFLRVTVDV